MLMLQHNDVIILNAFILNYFIAFPGILIMHKCLLPFLLKHKFQDHFTSFSFSSQTTQTQAAEGVDLATNSRV